MGELLDGLGCVLWLGEGYLFSHAFGLLVGEHDRFIDFLVILIPLFVLFEILFQELYFLLQDGDLLLVLVLALLELTSKISLPS